ncbi:hypothetical protein N0V85_007822 [Neurospora sp. IMI 360204]|nr:hypothetical protein N0V85_007822 [Neurospora sp. IMI 360204]
MTTGDFKNDSESVSSTQTPSQRFAAVVDDFLDAKHPFIESITERRDRTAPENSSASKHQEAQLRALINDFSRDVAAKKKNSKSSKALDKLGPFVLSLAELAKFCETVVGASPDDRFEYDEEEEEDEEYDEQEFDEDEEESESEKGSETEGDSNLIDSSTNATDPECDIVTDVLVIVREEGNPVWVPCHGRQKTRRQMGGTLHPREPVFVWAQDAESLSIMNTVGGKTATSSLPKLSEGDGPLLPEAQIAEKEQMPHLGARFGWMTCQYPSVSPTSVLMPSTSVFHFDLQRQVHQDLPLSPSTSDNNSQPQPKVQTLNRTVLTPSSTSQRRPRLRYQSRASKSKPDDSLYLVLDPKPKLATPTQAEDRRCRQDTGKCSDQCDYEDTTTCHHEQEDFHRGGASVIRWSIPREGGWRDWDPEKDSMSDELKRNPSLCTFNELRGTFIDADKMFSVPIRGALDFTWKGYLWLETSL